MERTYIINRHIFLLKKNHRSTEENTELLNYRVCLQIDLVWKMRFELQSLFENYLNSSITGEAFSDAIFGMRLKLPKKRDQFEADLLSGKITSFYPISDSKKLSEFLSILYFTTENWEEDEFETDEFRTLIQNQFLVFQQIVLDEEKK